MAINSVCISGNLVKDCETRTTQSGMQVHNFTVAVNNRRRNAQGEWEDVPAFVDCALFDRNGSLGWMTQHMRKGFKVLVHGRISQSTWTDKETQKPRSRLEVIVTDVDAQWPRRDQGQPQQAEQPPQYVQPRQSAQQARQQPARQDHDVYDEDIPF